MHYFPCRRFRSDVTGLQTVLGGREIDRDGIRSGDCDQGNRASDSSAHTAWNSQSFNIGCYVGQVFRGDSIAYRLPTGTAKIFHNETTWLLRQGGLSNGSLRLPFFRAYRNECVLRALVAVSWEPRPRGAGKREPTEPPCFG